MTSPRCIGLQLEYICVQCKGSFYKQSPGQDLQPSPQLSTARAMNIQGPGHAGRCGQHDAEKQFWYADSCMQQTNGQLRYRTILSWPSQECIKWFYLKDEVILDLIDKV